MRETEVPGILHHVMATFGVIFRNWKTFLPFLLVCVVAAVVLVGLMSEETYQKFQEVLAQTSEQMGTGDLGVMPKAGLLLISTVTTGGLSGSSSEVTVVFVVLIFLVIWLTTIYLLRHRLAGNKVRLRDGLYNAMTPLISTLVVFLVVLVQCVPIFVLIIAYSAAVQTQFLATPFYALVFFIFACLMLLISGYLLSSSVMAFVAVSVPGLYPMRALSVASELMTSRRVKFVIRLVALALALVVVWVLVMLPIIAFDLWLKQFEWAGWLPLVPVCLLIMTCFTGIYITAYLYLYYRWMIDYDVKNGAEEPEEVVKLERPKKARAGKRKLIRRKQK